MTDTEEDPLEPEYVDGFVRLTLVGNGTKLLLDQHSINAILEGMGATAIFASSGNYYVEESPAEIRRIVGERRKEMFTYQRRWMAWRKEMDRREGRFD